MHLGLPHRELALASPSCPGLRRKQLGLKSDLPGLVWFHFAPPEIRVLSGGVGTERTLWGLQGELGDLDSLQSRLASVSVLPERAVVVGGGGQGWVQRAGTRSQTPQAA